MNGIEILSTKNISLTCVNHDTGGADAYLALPVNILGLTYVVASYSSGNLAIISAYDDNKITLLFVKEAALSYRGLSYDR